mmetsp:Transcript_24230/g.81494  ORF Transcript_24230/g.81494 Transcript_24230/m.81494 type:complete len:206 (-) Transcript_24230:616-1233(-)
MSVCAPLWLRAAGRQGGTAQVRALDWPNGLQACKASGAHALDRGKSGDAHGLPTAEPALRACAPAPGGHLLRAWSIQVCSWLWVALESALGAASPAYWGGEEKLLCRRRRLRWSMAMVILPMAGTMVPFLATASLSKLHWGAKLMAITPSRSASVGIWKEAEGTPETTMSDLARASSRVTSVSATLMVPGTLPAQYTRRPVTSTE